MPPDDNIDALRPGETIGGYTIVRTIGSGGFGITYEAHNNITKQDVAIKEFFPAGLARRDGSSHLTYSRVEAETISWALKKFETTTTTLYGLSHPNIVRVYNYLSVNATGYMIMELLEGQTMKHWLASRASPPSLEEVQPIARPVMDALCYLHERGLIHRDIAPDNIFVTREGRPILIDFGSVSLDLATAQKQTRHGYTRGLVKPGYTAPEQSMFEVQPAPESDVYSMGAVLYTALLGASPADGLKRKDEVFYGRQDPYQPMAEKCPAGCPEAAARAIDKALALRPESRCRSIAELRDGIDTPGAAPGPEPTPLLLESDQKGSPPKATKGMGRRSRTLAIGVAGFCAAALFAQSIGFAIVVGLLLAGAYSIQGRIFGKTVLRDALPTPKASRWGLIPLGHRRTLLFAGSGVALFGLIVVGPWLVFSTHGSPAPTPPVSLPADGGVDNAAADPPDDDPAPKPHAPRRQHASHRKAR